MATEPLGDIELIHGYEPPEKRKKPIVPILFTLLIIAALVYIAYLLLGGKGFWMQPRRASSDTGYYSFNKTTYYKQDGIWYEYDDGLGWIMAAPSDEFLDNSDKYYEGVYNKEYSSKPFSQSDYYKPEQNYFGEGGNSNGQASAIRYESENDFDEENDW